jgi:hypothetical protein
MKQPETVTTNGGAPRTPPETGTDDQDRATTRDRIWNQSAEGLTLDKLPYNERIGE